MKRLKSAVLLIVCFSVLAGCMSKEEVRREREIKAEAERFAAHYITEKYGFKAEITDVRAHTRTVGIFVPETTYYTNRVTVGCKHDGKTFSVVVDVDANVGGDDYQYEEIKRDFVAFAQDRFSLESVAIPQSVEVNRIVNSANPADWPQGYWGKDEFYDGDMRHFIGNVSAASDRARTLITLLFGLDANQADSMMQRLSDEAEALQQMMSNKANITLACYDAAAFSPDAAEDALQNDEAFSLKLFGEINHVYNTRWESSGDEYITESFVKVYDYTQYSPARESEGWGAIEVCGYTVNGERFEEADLFFIASAVYDKDYWKTDATVLTSYFSYGGLYGNDSDWFPEHRYVRVHLAALFPEEVRGGKAFVVLDAYEARRNSNKPVTTVPSLRMGDYLYFDCFRSHHYAIGTE